MLHPLALAGCWLALLYGVSVAYVHTIERFDYADWWTDRYRFLIEDRSRRRL